MLVELYDMWAVGSTLSPNYAAKRGISSDEHSPVPAARAPGDAAFARR